MTDSPVPSASLPKGLGKELLWASLIHLIFLFGAFHNAVLKRELCAYSAPAATFEHQMQNPSEQLFQLEASLYMTAQTIHQGHFPYWEPTVQGGTPLLGKMMNGTFSPYHIPNYVMPLRFFPYMLFFKVILQSFVSFALTFLFVRLIRVGFWGSTFAAVLYALCPVQLVQGLFATFVAGTYLPLLLLLVELYVRGYRTYFLGLTPWVIALMFFSGHVEAAVRFQVVAGVYLIMRLCQEKKSLPQMFQRLLGCALPVGLGWLIASPQLLAGSEYVKESYNLVWRSIESFGWQFRTITKHFSTDDVPLLVLGWAGGIGGGYLFHQLRRLTRETEWKMNVAWKVLLSCGLLALGIACLKNVGLDGFVPRYAEYGTGWHEWAFEFGLLVLAFWAADHIEAPVGIRALAGVLGASALVFLKVPPFSNILASLPIFKQFHNTIYLFEYYFAIGILAGWALEAIAKPRDLKTLPMNARIRAPLLLGILWAAVLVSSPIQSLLLRSIGTGTREGKGLGAMMGRENYKTTADQVTLSGWVRRQPAPARIGLGLAVGNKIAVSGPATWTRTENGRILFSADLPLQAGQTQGMAIVEYPGGEREFLTGPEIHRPWRPPLWTVIAGVLGTALLLAFGGPLLSQLLVAGAAVYMFSTFPLWNSAPAGQIPLQLPGIQKIQKDPALFRVTHPDYSHFFNADYASLYGLSDIRGGGDNLDLRSMTIFNQFTASLYQSSAEMTRQMGLKLFGLANVKYLIHPPDPNAAMTAMFYQGPDMRITQNPAFLPRFLLVPNAVYLPVPLEISQWNQMGALFERLQQIVLSPRFQFQETLLLNDSPSDQEPAPSGAPVSSDGIQVLEHSAQKTALTVQSRRTAYLFMGDSFFPTWKATVNGQAVPILRSWITFRAVRVPAGTSRVEFFPRPVKLWGALGLSALLSAGLLLFHFRQHARFFVPTLPARADKYQPAKKESKPKLILPEADPAMDLACAKTAEVFLMAQVYGGLLFCIVWIVLRRI